MLQSAKTNLNVEQVFFSIAKDIMHRLAETDSKAEVGAPFNLIKCLEMNQKKNDKTRNGIFRNILA